MRRFRAANVHISPADIAVLRRRVLDVARRDSYKSWLTEKLKRAG